MKVKEFQKKKEMNPYRADCEQMKKQANHQDKILKYLMEEET